MLSNRLPRHPLALAIALTTLGNPVLASELPRQEQMLITATRTPQGIDDALAPVTVFSRDEIERLQATHLTDLLRRLPGADLRANGGPGSNSSLFLRGSNNDHTLILVDGQRISSATLGEANFQFLDPSQIERIEIVRGPRSSLYGSDAIGGVIQIFTRAGQQGSSLSAAIGNRGTYQISARHQARQGDWRYGASVSYQQTDGIDNSVNDAGPNGDEDGYRNRSVSANLGYTFGNGATADLRFFQTQAENEYDSSWTQDRPYADNWIQSVDASLVLPVSSQWLTTVRLGHSVDDSDNRNDDTSDHSHFRTSRDSASWQNDLTLASGQILSLGLDYYDDQVSSSSLYTTVTGAPIDERTTQAAFVQYQGQWQQLDWVIGGRHDDIEGFGEQDTGNLSLGLALNEQHRLVLAYGTAFKAPTFNDLYWPISPYSAGNPDLKPEEAENIEIGLRGRYAHLNWSLNLYRNEIDNLIAWAPTPTPANPWLWSPSNVNQAVIEGIELDLNAELAGWQLSTALSYNEPRDADSDKLLVNRARTNASVDLDRTFGRYSVGLGWEAHSGRYSDSANQNRVAGYSLTHLRLGVQLSPALKASLKVDNLFDRDYRLDNTYEQPGLTALLGLTYQL